MLPTPMGAKPSIRFQATPRVTAQESTHAGDRQPGGASADAAASSSGVWGGLWSFPEVAIDDEPRVWCRDTLGLDVTPLEVLPTRRHQFSHFVLEIHPLAMRANNPSDRIMEADQWVWYNPEQPQSRGLAAPVARLVREASNQNSGEEQ